MDQLTQTAQSLGSANVVVMTGEDMNRIAEILYRAGEEDFLTAEERLAISLIEVVDWICDGAVKANV